MTSTPEPEDRPDGPPNSTWREAAARWLTWTVIAGAIGLALWDASVELWG